MENLLVNKEREAMSPVDPQGRVALMLCESVLHVLVEEGVLTKEKAIEAIETVAELTREIAEAGLDVPPGKIRRRAGIAARRALLMPPPGARRF